VDAAFELAQANQERFEALGGTGPAGPLFQWSAGIEIEKLRGQFEAGDRWALFAAIRKCANHDLVMPDWVARGFIRGYDQVLNCKVGSWDEAYGAPYPKGARIAALKRRRELRFAVFHAVKKLHEVDPKVYPIDAGTFEQVGRQRQFVDKDGEAMGSATVGKLYYEAKRLLAFARVPR
jgi:hypothetical protein